MTVLFIFLTAVLFVLTVQTKTPLAFFRFLALLFSLFIFLSFWFGLLNIPIHIGIWTAVVALLNLCSILIKKKVPKWNLFGEKALIKNNVKSLLIKKSLRTSVLLLGGFAAAAVIGAVYFASDFSVPQFISIDPALHYIYADRMVIDEKLQYFSRSIFFPDSVNVSTYPYGTAVLTSLFFSLTTWMDRFASFQIFQVLLFALVNAYALHVFNKMFKFSRLELIVVGSILVTLSFFFNLMIMGFSSQLAGLFFMFACLDLYLSMRWSWEKVFSVAFLLSAVMQTYFNWIAYVILFAALQLVSLGLRKGWKQFKEYLRWNVFTLALFFLLSVHYFYLIFSSSLISVITTSNGLTYNVFLANVFIFIPLLVVYVFPYVRDIVMKRTWSGNGFSFLLASVSFTLALGILFLAGRFQQYIFLKNFYLTIPVMFCAAIKGLERLTKEKTLIQKLFASGAIFLIVYLAIVPFLIAYPSYQPQDSYAGGVDNLNVRPLDIFLYNGQFLINSRVHPYNIEKEAVDFSKHVAEYLPTEEKLTRVSVVCEQSRGLWFYAFSRIWPRDIPDQLSLWEPIVLDWSSWLSSRQSDYLIIIDDPVSREWINSSGFAWDLFDVVYEEEGNVLLRYREYALYSEK